MGSWNAEAPKSSESSLDNPRVVFLGHIVERMGLPLLLDVVEILKDRGSEVRTDVIGGGPALAGLQLSASARGIDGHITWHGFLADFAAVETLLAGASIAVAPYETNESSFSRFADPGKLKAYLGAGLPILLTDVPPNAFELMQNAGASVLQPDAQTFADEIERLVSHRDEWSRRHRLSLEHAQRFDWENLFSESLPRLGIAL
jgi:glycosyltransferase involved in cell wall biosynthesis